MIASVCVHMLHHIYGIGLPNGTYSEKKVPTAAAAANLDHPIHRSNGR
jgi:hypothetical protein